MKGIRFAALCLSLLLLLGTLAGCAETLLQAIRVYIAPELNVQALETMAAEGFHSIRFEGSVICPTDTNCALHSLFSGKELEYTVQK